MFSTNGECFVGSDDVLRALEAAGSNKSLVAPTQATDGQDVLVQYYQCNMASDQAQLQSSKRIREVVMREFLLCLQEDHITLEILDALCKFVEFEPLAKPRLIAYYKMYNKHN